MWWGEIIECYFLHKRPARVDTERNRMHNYVVRHHVVQNIYLGVVHIVIVVILINKYEHISHQFG